MISVESVQSLLIKMRIGNHVLGTGTGFVVSKGENHYLITNRHNVTGRNNDSGEMFTSHIPDNLLIMHNIITVPGLAWESRVEPLEFDYQPLWIEHPTLGARADFVALLLTQIENVKFFPYDINPENQQLEVRPADAVSVIGFPFGLTAGYCFGIWSTGFMASEPEIDFEGLPIFLIDCRTRQGQSGSAVIAYINGGSFKNKDGSRALTTGTITNLLGIYSGRINKESDLGKVWKTSAIKELIDSI